MSDEHIAAVMLAQDRLYVAALTLTDLRALWAQVRRDTRDAIRNLDFWQADGLLAQRHEVLIPEFTRRGFICQDPQTRMILDQPRKA